MAQCDTTIGICADGAQARKELEKTTQSVEGFSKKSKKSFKEMGDSIAGAGKKMSLFVTGPLVAFGGFAIKAASDAEEMRSKFNVVFGEVADDATAWAQDFARSVGRATSDVQGWMATLQDTFVPLGFARKEAANMSKELSALTVDIASFNNAAEPDVLRDIQSAIVGNHETMRKYGVIITQATLDQELMNMGIMDGVKAATEQEKAMARMNIIMAGTTDAHGDAIKTAGSFANTFRALRSRTKELMEEFGKILLPTMSKLVRMMTKAVDWINQLSDTQKKWIVRIGAVVAAIGPMLLIVGKIIAILPALKAGMAAVNAVMAANPILAVVAAVALLTTGAILLIKNWEKVRAFFVKVFDKIKSFAEEMPGWLLAVITAVAPFIGLPLLILRNWEAISETLAKMWIWLRDNAIFIFQKMKEGVLQAMKGAIEGLIKIREVFPGEAEKLRNALGKVDAALVSTQENMEGLTRTTWDSIEVEKRLKKNTDEAAAAQEALADGVENAKDAMTGAQDPVAEYGEIMGQLAINTKEYADVSGTSVVEALYSQIEVMDQVVEKVQDLEAAQAQAMASGMGFGLGLSQGLEQMEMTAGQVVNDMGYMTGEIDQMFNQSFTNRSAELDNWYKEQQEAINQNITNEEQRNEALSRLDEQYQQKQRALAKDAAKQGKAAAVVQSIINTAEGVTKALAQGGFIFGIPMAGVIGAMGAVQTALIAAQPLPFQQGGVVGEGLGDRVPIMAEPGEMVISKENVRRNRGMLNQMQGGMGPQPIKVYIGEELIYDNITDAIDDRRVKVRKEAII